MNPTFWTLGNPGINLGLGGNSHPALEAQLEVPYYWLTLKQGSFSCICAEVTQQEISANSYWLFGSNTQYMYNHGKYLMIICWIQGTYCT